jgi:hypothetical protein
VCVPTFCRHNRFVENCRICTPREPGGGQPRSAAPAPARRASGGTGRSRSAAGLRVRHAERAADDGYRSGLASGLRAEADAGRLADEIAFAAGRLAELAAAPPGPYAEAAAAQDPEEGLWLAFLIAYIGPAEGDDPFGAIESARVPWSSGEVPLLDGVVAGPRGAYEEGRGARTISAYRAWAQRAGSQREALAGDDLWKPDRRFARAFERLALPGLHRAARFELLVSLGRLGLADVRAGLLFLGAGDGDTTIAAKRAFGIGDPLLLERRAADLAAEAQVPLEALDLALFNWGRGEHTLGGASEGASDEAVRARVRAALEIG